MIAIDVRGMTAVQAALSGIARQMPYILSTAINSTAFSVRTVEQARMKAVFNAPAPWLVRQVRVEKATKQNLTAVVTFDTPKARAIIEPHVTSGARGRKPYELVLQRMGILPVNMRAVPSSAFSRNASGDPSRAAINRMIKGLSIKGSGYFTIKTQGRRLHPGIWFKGKRGQIKPQFLFVSQAVYKERCDFTGVGEAEVRRIFPVEFEKAWSKAIETAR